MSGEYRDQVAGLMEILLFIPLSRDKLNSLYKQISDFRNKKALLYNNEENGTAYYLRYTNLELRYGELYVKQNKIGS